MLYNGPDDLQSKDFLMPFFSSSNFSSILEFSLYVDGEHRTGGDPVWSSFHGLLLPVHLGSF